LRTPSFLYSAEVCSLTVWVERCSRAAISGLVEPGGDELEDLALARG
jgi:hypothetical protein